MALGAVGVATPSAASAADACPNAAVRAQQHATHLPNCMAYEKVTPDEKGGAFPATEGFVAADGSGILYHLNAGIEDAQSFATAKYRALRGPNGWATNAIHPPFTGEKVPKLNDGIGPPQAASSDLSRVLVGTGYPVNPNDKGVANAATGAGSDDLYLREPDGSFTWIAPDPAAVDTSQAPVTMVGASPEVDRVVVQTTRQFDPRVTTSDVPHLYMWTRSGMRLVSVLPNGELPESVAKSDRYANDKVQAVSADGRRVAFTAMDADGAAHLYVRFDADDPDRARTVEVAVGPNGEACSSVGTLLRGFSADGTKVLFACANPLVPGAPEGATYERDIDGGPGAVRSIGTGLSAAVGGSADFSLVHFNSGRYDETGNYNVRVLARDGVLEDTTPPAREEEGYDAVSSDGQYRAIQSSADFGLPGVNIVPRGPGTGQVYLYSARTRKFECISCRQDGAPTDGNARLVPASLGQALQVEDRALNLVSDRGTVAFTTNTALVPQDTNGVTDPYAWIDGRAVLLSSGRDEGVSFGSSATPDGSTFYITTADALVPDDVDGGARDIYAVRPGGGFLVPDPPAAPCAANCQAPAPERPSTPGVGSVDAGGRGNAAPVSRKPVRRTKASLVASKSVRGSRTTVRVTVSHAGSIRLSGSGLRTVSVRAGKAGTYRVAVRLSASGLKRQGRKGRLTARVTARFTPKAGASVRAQRSVTFTAVKKKGGR